MIAPVTVLLGVGWIEWTPQRVRWVLCAATVGVLSLLLFSVPAGVERSALLAPADLAYLADEDITPVGIEYGDELYLVGYATDEATVARGQTLTVRLIWLARKRPAEDYTVSVEVTGRQRMQVGIADSMPGGGRLPTSNWIPGQITQDEIMVPISPLANTPSKGDIRVTVYRGAKESAIEAMAPNGARLGTSPSIGTVRLVPPSDVRYEPAGSTDITFGSGIRLFGFSVTPAQPELGSPWTVDLYWEAVGPIHQDYTVFCHLVNAYGRILAQTDEQPLQGDYPSSMWREGEQVHDSHVLQVPETMQGEPFYLLVGLYNAETGERLDYATTDGMKSDHVTLGPLLPTEP